MFRLRGWPFDPSTVKKPGVIGKYTNDIVYDRLAPGVREELQKLNPVTDKGYRKKRHHQWLTGDIGHPKLREHLAGVIALMRAAPNWRKFMEMINRALPRHNETLPIEFRDDDDE